MTMNYNILQAMTKSIYVILYIKLDEIISNKDSRIHNSEAFIKN